MSVPTVHPEQLELVTDHLLADLDERRERHVSASRRTRAERRAERLRATQGAGRCRCERSWPGRSGCLKCGRTLP